MMTICVDVYCPSQTVFLRQEAPKNGLESLDRIMRRIVTTSKAEQVQYIDK